jgi:CheY-like chemotaxis protein
MTNSTRVSKTFLLLGSDTIGSSLTRRNGSESLEGAIMTDHESKFTSKNDPLKTDIVAVAFDQGHTRRKDPAQELADSTQVSSEFNEYLEYFLELQKIRASKKVLIVEDDPISLLGLRHIVKNFNPDIKCFLAINIDEALDILEKEKCDLLISDYYLSPTETGLELWDLVRQQHPEVDVVITSGIGMDKYRQIVQNCDFPPPFFDKPFSAEKFNGYLKEIFGSASNGQS